MPQLNDLTVGVVGSGLNDGLLAHYKSNGATSNDLNDAEVQYLIARGVAPGDVADMWETYLTGKAYTGNITEMKYSWWSAGAPL